MDRIELSGSEARLPREEYSGGPFVFDLFAGCGGLALGLELAGFKPLFVNELNADALETYLVNREQEYPLLRQKYNVKDVKTLVDEAGLLKCILDGLRVDAGVNVENGELDLLVGGPPCQGYSGIGHRRSYAVERERLPSNFLFEDMAFLVERLNPKIFLFENVRGLLSARWTKDGEKGEVWQRVVARFHAAGNGKYDIRADLVHAKDYGVPQNRPRVLMVGVRRDLGFSPRPVRSGGKDKFMTAVAAGFLPDPRRLEVRPPSLKELLSDLEDPAYSPGQRISTDYAAEPSSEIQVRLRTGPQGSIDETKLTEQEYSRHSPRIVAKFSAMLESGGAIPAEHRTKKFAQRLLPAEWGNEGPTITATSLPDDYVHYSQPRILTVREWARLQMFPDWYQFAGKRTTGGTRRAGNPRQNEFEREVPKYTQIGNAVPVELARHVGLHLRSILEAM